MGSRNSSNKDLKENVCTDGQKNKSTSCNAGISVPLHLFAAGTAAAVSAVAVQPLEVLKIRLQTNVVAKRNIFANLRHIFRAEGINGLYRGLVPTLGSVVPSISIYFTLYNSIKSHMGCPSGDPVKDVVMQSAAAGIASSATAAITNPLWLIKTRLQSQPLKMHGASRGTYETFRNILREEGVRGLYKGLGASFLASSQAMVQFPIYEELKSLMVSNEHTLKRSTCNYFAASAISASLACILTYPAEVVRARLQAQHGLIRYNGILHAFRKIWAQEGVAGLYRGLFTSILKMTPAHAISFTAYEFILRSINYYSNWNLSDIKDIPKNENVQYSFRPFLPPNFEPSRYLAYPAARYVPHSNPYSFMPSFTHIITSSLPNSDLDSNTAYRPCEVDAGCVDDGAKRWSEYFW